MTCTFPAVYYRQFYSCTAVKSFLPPPGRPGAYHRHTALNLLTLAKFPICHRNRRHCRQVKYTAIANLHTWICFFPRLLHAISEKYLFPRVYHWTHICVLSMFNLYFIGIFVPFYRSKANFLTIFEPGNVCLKVNFWVISIYNSITYDPGWQYIFYYKPRYLCNCTPILFIANLLDQLNDRFVWHARIKPVIICLLWPLN